MESSAECSGVVQRLLTCAGASDETPSKGRVSDDLDALGEG